MKPIQTVYKGYHFRSRLEARWAVFFDALDIPFTYEREGYDLAGQWYLPDFWLPEQQCWIEIKGEMPTVQEYDKAQLLARLSGKAVFMFAGEIQIPHVDGRTHASRAWSYPIKPELGYTFIEAGLTSHAWAECPLCGSLGITEGGDITHLPCGCFARRFPDFDPLQVMHPYPAEGSTVERRLAWFAAKLVDLRKGFDTPALIKAYEAARGARFEHGEAR